MASIKKYLDAIKAAVYGEEVRGSIHDAIKAIYDIATGAQGSATASANTAIAKASEAVAAAKEVTAKAGEAIEAAEQAQTAADNASAVSGIKIATQTTAGIIKGGENYIDESGELQLTKRTDSPTLYNSYAGGIKLNELGGASEQDSTTGAQLFDFFSIYSVDGTVINIENNGKRITLSGTAAYAKGTINVTESIFESIKGTRVTLYGDIVSKTNTSAPVVILFVITNADDSKTWYGITGISNSFIIPEDAKRAHLELAINNAATTLSTTNTVVFEDVMLNAGSTALPWEPFTGNAASPSLEYPQVIKPVEGKNLLDCRGLTEQTNGGVTFTPVYDANGNLEYVEANGTSSTLSEYCLCSNYSLPNGIYILSGANASNKKIFVNYGSIWATDVGNGVKFGITDSSKVSVVIQIETGVTCNKDRFYPMIRPASIADDTYVPYGLLRFWGHGENQCHILETDYGYVEPDAKYTHIVQYRYIKVFLKAGTYTISEHGATDKFLKLLRIVSDDYYYGGVTTITNGSYTFYHEKDGEVYFSFGRATTFGGTSVDDTFTEDELLEYVIQINESYFITLSNPIKLNGVGTAQDKFVRKDSVWKIERNIVERAPLSLTHVKDFTNTKVYQATFAEEPLLLGGATPAYCNRLIYKYSQSDEEHFYITNTNSAYLYVPIDYTPVASDFEFLCVLAEPTYEDLPTADQIALNSLVSYNGITYLHCDSEVQPTWDLEYGTSRVGGYTLEAWNKEENNRIKIEELTTAMLVINQE